MFVTNTLCTPWCRYYASATRWKLVLLILLILLCLHLAEVPADRRLTSEVLGGVTEASIPAHCESVCSTPAEGTGVGRAGRGSDACRLCHVA